MCQRLNCLVILCCFFSPNESKRPRTLSKLSDTSVWERRRTKGRVAIQKMVVDLMELYLHRLRQRRPPYPKSPAMAEFEAQFSFEPTPDQKQVLVTLSHTIILDVYYFHSTLVFLGLRKFFSNCNRSWNVLVIGYSQIRY